MPLPVSETRTLPYRILRRARQESHKRHISYYPHCRIVREMCKPWIDVAQLDLRRTPYRDPATARTTTADWSSSARRQPRAGRSKHVRHVRSTCWVSVQEML